MQNAQNAWTVTEPEIMEMPRLLDGDTATELEQDLRLCIKSGARELILDCAQTENLTSAGLRSIMALVAEMRNVQGKLAVCNLQGQPRAIFKACGYDETIPTFATQNEAVARLAA